MPLVVSGPDSQAQFAHSGQMALELFRLMVDDPKQARDHLNWNEKLQYSAYLWCYRQAHFGTTGHQIKGIWANEWVRNGGYRLPAHYPNNKNNIQSLSHGGDGTAAQTWQGLAHPEVAVAGLGHRLHVLGLDPFYAAQTEVGIGYYAGGEKKHYWCIFSAPPEMI